MRKTIGLEIMDISIIIITLIIEPKELNDLFEKICREMYGKRRANSHYHHLAGRV